jgi:hypothetical protein
MTSDTSSSRLARELQRLYLSSGKPCQGGIDLVRALVLGVSRPAAWEPLGAVWKGVQTDLELPAPAIAVNGSDGLQLWFSLADGVGAAQGQAFLDGLRAKYLSGIPAHRMTMQCTAVGAPLPGSVHADEQWSAFVAADLAPLFESSPWLDMPPSEEGQAELLARLRSIQPGAFNVALGRLRVGTDATVDAPPGPGGLAPGHRAHPAAEQFLLQVMNDTAAPMALRVEAAKALLPYGLAR